MIWYVAAIAIINLGLGYVLAKWMGSGCGRNALAAGGSVDAHESADY